MVTQTPLKKHRASAEQIHERAILSPKTARLIQLTQEVSKEAEHEITSARLPQFVDNNKVMPIAIVSKRKSNKQSMANSA